MFERRRERHDLHPAKGVPRVEAATRETATSPPLYANLAEAASCHLPRRPKTRVGRMSFLVKKTSKKPQQSLAMWQLNSNFATSFFYVQYNK